MKSVSINELNEKYLGSMAKNLAMKITEVHDGLIVGEMPVGPLVQQPFGIVHGGAYCTFAETLGSIGANLIADEGKRVVGTSLTASYVKKVDRGVLKGYARVRHRGSRVSIWQIDVHNDKGDLAAVLTLHTMAI
jgi:1,4-dihydroxy-2-naphthoyl-CoA hydrolase